MYMAEQARQQTRNRVGKVSVYRTQTRIGRGPAHPHLDLETPSTRLPFSSPMPGPRNGTRSSYHATVCSLSCCSCCCCCFTVLLKIDHVVIAFVLCGCSGTLMCDIALKLIRTPPRQGLLVSGSNDLNLNMKTVQDSMLIYNI